MDRCEMVRKRRSEIREFREMRCEVKIPGETARLRTRTRTRTKKMLKTMIIIAASKGWQRGLERQKGSGSLSAGCLGSVWSGDALPEGRRGRGARRWVAKTPPNEGEGYPDSTSSTIRIDP
jgi:hypothetical protein